MKKSFELKKERQALVDEARAAIEKVETEKRDFSPEEKTAQEERMAKIDQLSSTIKERESLEGLQDVDSRDLPKPMGTPESREESPEDKEIRELGEAIMEKRDYVSTMNSSAFRKNTVDSKIREGLSVLSQVRSVANVTSSGSDQVIPVDAGDVAVDIIAEGADYGDGGGTLGSVEFKPLKVGAMIKFTDEALKDVPANLVENAIAQVVRARSKKENLWFITGDGTTKPEGILTGASEGIVTASATAITTSELRGLFTSLPSELLPYSYGWCNQVTMVKLLELTDKNKGIEIKWDSAAKMYLVQGIPFFINANMPDMTTGNKPIVIGDTKNFYEIKDRDGLEVKVLDQLYAAAGKIGYRFTSRMDAHVMESEAFKYLAMA